MSFVSVTMVLMAAFVLIAPVVMAAILATGGRSLRQTVALARVELAPVEPERAEAALPRAA